MLTIKQAATLVDGLSEYRVRQMCITGELKHIRAGKKYLINQDVFFAAIGGNPADYRQLSLLESDSDSESDSDENDGE
jgi:excisionase family DNA binding protein